MPPVWQVYPKYVSREDILGRVLLSGRLVGINNDRGNKDDDGDNNRERDHRDDTENRHKRLLILNKILDLR